MADLWLHHCSILGHPIEKDARVVRIFFTLAGFKLSFILLLSFFCVCSELDSWRLMEMLETYGDA